MKNCIITQAKDQSNRLKDWIIYHKEQGFDLFIYFDDFSEDDSIENLKEISLKHNINIIINNTDGLGSTKTKVEMSNSNSYLADTSINNRIIRSYNKGLEISRNINPDMVCAIIDVDEFLVTNRVERVADVIKDTMLEKKTKHLYIHSFDVSDDFEINDWYSTNEITRFRWDYDYRNDTVYKYRGKSICVSSEIEKIPEGPNYVHSLRDCDVEYINKINVTDFDTLRIHHYRKPCMDKSFKFIEDRTLLDKMKKIKEKYDL
jgi:hypothetical protein